MVGVVVVSVSSRHGRGGEYLSVELNIEHSLTVNARQRGKLDLGIESHFTISQLKYFCC